MLKNKRIKRLTVIVLTFILTFSVNLFGCNCYLTGKGLVADDYFIYWISGDGSFAGLIGLTELGRQQEYLIVPQYVDGVIPVEQFGGFSRKLEHVAKEYGEDCAGFNSSVLKRIYVPFFIEELHINGDNYGDETREDFAVVIFDVKEIEAYPPIGVKLSYKAYSERVDHYGSPNTLKVHLNFDELGRQENMTPANVTYLYNYEEAPNEGDYWVDDYDGEVISYVPENPVREGYTFGGWYKEPECINKWNFTKDIVSKKTVYLYKNEEIHSEYYVYSYHETKLYAKWIKNS